MILDKTDLILLSKIEHELNILLSCDYIHNQYGQLHTLNILRKDLLSLLKSSGNL